MFYPSTRCGITSKGHSSAALLHRSARRMHVVEPASPSERLRLSRASSAPGPRGFHAHTHASQANVIRALFVQVPGVGGCALGLSLFPSNARAPLGALGALGALPGLLGAGGTPRPASQPPQYRALPTTRGPGRGRLRARLRVRRRVLHHDRQRKSPSPPAKPAAPLPRACVRVCLMPLLALACCCAGAPPARAKHKGKREKGKGKREKGKGKREKTKRTVIYRFSGGYFA